MTSEPRKPLPPPRFSEDDGSPSAGVEAALVAFDRGDGGSAQVLAALAGGRLLVPVVAVADEVGEDGAEKESHMATVMTTGRDGRRGLLAFTCIDAVRLWDPKARPMPIPTRSAAEAALAEGADALVIDLAGPVKFAVDVPELRSLASGWRPLDPWGGVDEAERTGRVLSPGAGREVGRRAPQAPAGFLSIARRRVRATGRRVRATGRRVRATGRRMRATGGRVGKRLRRTS